MNHEPSCIHLGFGQDVKVFRFVEDAASIACQYVWQCHFFWINFAQSCHPTLSATVPSLQLRDWT